MLSVARSVIVLNLVTIVITYPAVNNFHQENVTQDNEVITASDKEHLFSKNPVEVKKNKSRSFGGKIFPVQKEAGYNKNFQNTEYFEVEPESIKNSSSKFVMNEGKIENIEAKTFNKLDKFKNNLEQKQNKLKNNLIDSNIEDISLSEEEDLQRNTRQYEEKPPIVNGLINRLTPVQIDQKAGPLNDDGLNYVQVNPEQANMYLNQGVTFSDKLPSQEYMRGPPRSLPFFQYAHPQNHQPMVVIQPIVIPALKEEEKKCPTLALPVIKDKHPHIEIKHIKLPSIVPEKKPTTGLVDRPLIPSLLTTILPALIPLLTKKEKEPKKKPVIYFSKQFLINPNVVPSISIPPIIPHPKELDNVSNSEQPTYKEVDSFLNDLMENNLTLSHEYLRSAIENEEIHLANLQSGKTDPLVGSSKRPLPAELRERLLKRVAELDTEVGEVSEKLLHLQSQQNLAHAIAATVE